MGIAKLCSFSTTIRFKYPNIFMMPYFYFLWTLPNQLSFGSAPFDSWAILLTNSTFTIEDLGEFNLNIKLINKFWIKT